MEGNYLQALQFLPPVLAVTLGCCLWAVRWAVDQFNRESVLFRESERLELGAWVRHLVHDRGPIPTVAGAVFCAIVILLIRFFMSFHLPVVDDFRSFAVIAIATQLAVILTPALLMTVMLTNSARRRCSCDGRPGRRPSPRRFSPWFCIPRSPCSARR